MTFQDYYKELFPEKKSLSPDLLARASISLVLLDLNRNAHQSSVGMITCLLTQRMLCPDIKKELLYSMYTYSTILILFNKNTVYFKKVELTPKVLFYLRFWWQNNTFRVDLDLTS